jgi:hypothetical protein
MLAEAMVVLLLAENVALASVTTARKQVNCKKQRRLTIKKESMSLRLRRLLHLKVL